MQDLRFARALSAGPSPPLACRLRPVMLLPAAPTATYLPYVGPAAAAGSCQLVLDLDLRLPTRGMGAAAAAGGAGSAAGGGGGGGAAGALPHAAGWQVAVRLVPHAQHTWSQAGWCSTVCEPLATHMPPGGGTHSTSTTTLRLVLPLPTATLGTGGARLGAGTGGSRGAPGVSGTSVAAAGGSPLQLPASGTLEVLLLRPPSSHHQQHIHSRTQPGACTQVAGGRTRAGALAGGSGALDAGSGSVAGAGGPACAVLLLHEQPLCGAALLQLPSAPWGGGVGHQGWTTPVDGSGAGGALGVGQANGSPFRLPVRFLFTCRAGAGGEDGSGGAAGLVAGRELEAWLREVWLVPQGQGQGQTGGGGGARPQGLGQGQGQGRLQASGCLRLCGGRATAAWSAQVVPSGAGGGQTGLAEQQQQQQQQQDKLRPTGAQGAAAAGQEAAAGQRQGQGGNGGGATCVLAHPQRLDVRLELVADSPELLASLQGGLLGALGEGRGLAGGGGRSPAGGAAVQSGEKLHEAIRELRRLAVAVQRVRVELEQHQHQHQHQLNRLQQVACLSREYEGAGGQGAKMEMDMEDVGRGGVGDGGEGAAEGAGAACWREASLVRLGELRKQLQQLHAAYSVVAASSLMLAV